LIFVWGTPVLYNCRIPYELWANRFEKVPRTGLRFSGLGSEFCNYDSMSITNY